MRVRGGALVAACGALTLTRAAWAGVTLEVRPLFGETCLPREGSGEVRVRIDNTGSRAVRGSLIVDATMPRADRPRTRHAWTVNVGARSDVSVSVDTPTVLAGGEMTFRLVGDDGRTLATTTLALRGGESSLLLDATPGHRFANAQHSGEGSILDLTGFRDGAADSPAVFTGVTCGVDRPGGSDLPRLPRLAAGYRGVAMVLIDSTSLNALGPAERNSLAGYIADGGALAVVVRSPNDLRHATLSALVGDGVTARPLPPLVRAPDAEQFYPWAPSTHAAVMTSLPAALAGARSWGDGHLRPQWLASERDGILPELLGSSARYGNGLVHLLSWDPAQTSSLEDPWSARTVLRIAARARLDATGSLVTPVPETLPVPDAVRRYLTAPRRSGRGLVRAWTVVAVLASALLVLPWALCRARRSRLVVPLQGALAALAWAVLAREAALHRAVLSHTRTLAVLDVASGFSRASGRRFHAIVGDRRRVASLAIDHPERVVAVDPTAGRGPITRFVGTEVSSVEGVGLLPWTPVIVREDGPDDLRGAVTLRREDSGSLALHNGLPWPLREVILVDATSGSAWTFAYIAPGRDRRAQEGRPLPRPLAARFVEAGLTSLPLWGSAEARARVPLPAIVPADVGARLDRWFGRPTNDDTWEAVLASAAVPGRSDRWRFAAGAGLVARVDRPGARVRGGLAVASETTWLRVHEESLVP